MRLCDIYDGNKQNKQPHRRARACVWEQKVKTFISLCILRTLRYNYETYDAKRCFWISSECIKTERLINIPHIKKK